ncbi:hypothetical protein DFH09DRAFT_1489897 [Mycena vulgaris]|nr:hypothetical protein DFH09DRAFT_1489897 [Mycena vulgaris]
MRNHIPLLREIVFAPSLQLVRITEPDGGPFNATRHSFIWPVHSEPNPGLEDFYIEVPPREFHHVVSLEYRQILLANPDIFELGIIGRDTGQQARIPRCSNINNDIRALRVDVADVIVPRFRAFYIHDQVVDLDMQAVISMVAGRIELGLERLCITACRMRALPRDVRAGRMTLEIMGLDVQLKEDDEKSIHRTPRLLQYL